MPDAIHPELRTFIDRVIVPALVDRWEREAHVKTIGVIGSRRRNSRADFLAVETAVRGIYEPGDRFVSGGAPAGGDRFAELIARELGATIVIHYAGWNTHGKKAGFMRNGDIARDADELIACVAPDRTGGTEDTIRKFQAAHNKEPILV